jgi:hypothetical protein
MGNGPVNPIIDEKAPAPAEGRVKRWLTWRDLPIALAVLAALLASPCLWGGLDGDDYLLAVSLVDTERFPAVARAPWDGFRFFDQTERGRATWLDLATVPWWAMKSLKLAFFRPVSSLTHWLDFHLWGERPGLMHAQSLFWFALSAAAATVLYRRMMGPTWIAGLAALFYAVDDARNMPASWLANRNTLIAAAFGIAAILVHDRWRRDGWRPGAILGPLLLLISLLSAEAGVAVLAYIFAHAVFLDPGVRRRRILAVAPYVAIVLLWRVTYTSLGYGTYGSGFYIDPGADPLGFAFAVVERAPLLLLGQLALPPSDLYLVLRATGGILIHWIVAVLALAAFGRMLWPVLRTSRVGRFWALGMSLSVVPICATVPMDRLLQFVGVGAFGLLAQFVAAGLAKPTGPEPERGRRKPTLLLCAGLLVIHCVLAPIILLLRCSPLDDPADTAQLHLKGHLDASVERQTVVVVNSPLALHLVFARFARDRAGLPVPRAVRCLAPSLTSVELRRPDERTIVLRPDSGYLSHAGDEVFRDRAHGMALGERVVLADMTVEVTALTEDGRPAEAAFWFPVPLEHPSLRWLQFRDGVYRPFTPPAVGEQVRIDADAPSDS